MLNSPRFSSNHVGYLAASCWLALAFLAIHFIDATQGLGDGTVFLLVIAVLLVPLVGWLMNFLTRHLL